MRANRASQQRSGYAAARLLAFAFGGIAALSVSLRCTSPDSLAGTGSQAGNGRITCAIHNSDGTPAAGAAVLLRRKDYLADTAGAALGKAAGTSRDSRTNTQGVFNLDSIDTGTYCVEVNDGASHAVLLACSVSVTDTLVRLPDDTLQPTGAIKGALASAPGNSIALYIQVYGLERVGARDTATGGFIIENIPRGRYTLRMSASSADYRPLELTGVVVASREISDVGKVDFLPLSAWLHSARLYLNTASAGAGVAGTVVNFPVLVRLRTVNFNFSQANADGGDVRFAKPDGTRLPYETERYDVGSQESEIWVKVDTVYGNDSSQYFIMYWGNPNATGSSNGESVFDTANGYIGVWHLADAGNANAGDATLHHYDGTPTDTAPQTIPGAIGAALQFDGNANGLVMKNTAHTSLNFSRPGTYTFSAWVYVDTVYDADEFIAGKGYDQYSLRVKGSTSYPSNLFALHEYVDAPIYGTEMRFAPVVTKQWKYIVGIRDTANSYLFADGTCVDSSGTIFYSKGDVQDSTNFSIGRCAASYTAPPNSNNYLAFKGKIDEVRIAAVHFSADWVKLSYMNQKEQDALIKW